MTSLLITGGRVVDPASFRDEICDIAVQDGVIAAIGTGLGEAEHTIDATGLVVAPGFIDLHAHGQSIPADRMQAFDGVTTTLDLEAGAMPVASWYARQAAQGRILNYGAAVNWAFARIGAMTGGNEESSLEAFGRAMRDRRWVDNVATEAEQRGILDRLQRGLDDGGIGIGILNAYAPGAGVQELTSVCELAAAHGVATFTHVAYMSRHRSGELRRGLHPADRLCRRHRLPHAHLSLQQLQQDRRGALRPHGGQGPGAGPAGDAGGVSLRHRVHGVGSHLLQRTEFRRAHRHRLRRRAARHRRPPLPQPRGDTEGAGRRTVHPRALAFPRHRQQRTSPRIVGCLGDVSRRRHRFGRDAMEHAGRLGLHRRFLAIAGRGDLASPLRRHLHPLPAPLGAGASGRPADRRAGEMHLHPRRHPGGEHAGDAQQGPAGSGCRCRHRRVRSRHPHRPIGIHRDEPRRRGHAPRAGAWRADHRRRKHDPGGAPGRPVRRPHG